MTCQKCNGLMVEEWLAEELDEAYAWRCVNCGSFLDSTIDRNRQPGYRQTGTGRIPKGRAVTPA